MQFSLGPYKIQCCGLQLEKSGGANELKSSQVLARPDIYLECFELHNFSRLLSRILIKAGTVRIIGFSTTSLALNVALWSTHENILKL